MNRHYSDCAMNNAPAMQAGECDCGAIARSKCGLGLYHLVCIRASDLRNRLRELGLRTFRRVGGPSIAIPPNADRLDVTPAMVEAGADVLMDFESDSSAREFAARVYRQMELSRQDHPSATFPLDEQASQSARRDAAQTKSIELELATCSRTLEDQRRLACHFRAESAKHLYQGVQFARWWLLYRLLWIGSRFAAARLGRLAALRRIR